MVWRRGAASVVGAAMLLGCAAGAPGDDGASLLVAGASDLQPAFTELGARFTADTGVEVSFDFGSSGQIAQRIIEGQPVDVFASANAAFVDQVLDSGIGDADTRDTYAFGRIVLWARTDRWDGWETLVEAATDRQVVSFAIANPEHAPYGTAGQQALAAGGVLDDVDDRLVLGENISDTLRLLETGNADVGIVALSLAIAADDRGEGTWVLLDAELHEPLQQDLVVTAADAGQAELARDFVAFVTGEEGREVLRRFGLLLPGEELAR